MTQTPDPEVTRFELADTRNALNVLRTQVELKRIDEQFLLRQINKVNDLLSRVENQINTGKQARRFEALYNVSRILGSSLDRQVVLDQVMDAIIQLTSAERGFLMFADDDGEIAVQAARNIDQQTLTDEEFKYSRTVTNHVLDTGEPLLIVNAAEDPILGEQASIATQSLRSIMATPLRARGSVIGVVYVDSRIAVGLFSEDDLAALDMFSAQAAIALDNARLFAATGEALSKRLDELRQLRRIDMQLNETLDTDKAVALTLEWACRVSDATGGILGLVEGDHLRCGHRYGKVRLDTGIEILDSLYPQVSSVLQTGETLVFDDAGAAVLMTPILREQKTIGVIILYHEDGQPFTAEQHDLVGRVVVRAATAIENAYLYAAVRAADKAKSEFVGSVAHDLKAPMTGIRGYADLMLMIGGLNEEFTDYVETIISTVERMERLVSDLSDISRIESGYFSMTENVIEVETVLWALRGTVMPQIELRGHTFVEQVDENLPKLWTDSHRLLQVLTNLVSNAYKYTPDGGTITLSARNLGQRVAFSVSDTGIGMSEADLTKLGTKFWRAYNEQTMMQTGTGLGFSITQALVERMGSKITVESSPGKGSTFTFSVAAAPA